MAEDETNELFVYPQLDHTRREFRLLRLTGTHEGDGIVCELRVFSLDHHTHHTWSALSYCWGTDTAASTISVNGEPFLVRANLHAFLTQLSQASSGALHEVEWIFIDAICIDQSNLSERAVQITLMRSIYHDAELVLTWLRDEKGTCTAESSKHEVMTTALGNPYWSRLWVVQEMVVARRLTIVLGQHSFTSQDALEYVQRVDRRGMFGAGTQTILDKPAYAIFFMDALRRKSYRAVGESPDSPAIETVSHQWAAARILNCIRQRSASPRNDQGMSFHDAINIFSAQRCTVAHDKVYGLLGGVTNCGIIPDYNRPLIELYAQLLTSYFLSLGLQKSSPLRVLESSLRAVEEELHGHIVFHSLGVDPADPAYLIVTKAVTAFFVIPGWGYVLHAAMLPVWVRVFQHDPDGDLEALPGRRRWYELSCQWRRRNHRDLLVDALAYATGAEREVARMRREDVVVAAPAGGPVYRVTEWEARVRAICEDLWARHTGVAS